MQSATGRLIYEREQISRNWEVENDFIPFLDEWIMTNGVDFFSEESRNTIIQCVEDSSRSLARDLEDSVRINLIGDIKQEHVPVGKAVIKKDNENLLNHIAEVVDALKQNNQLETVDISRVIADTVFIHRLIAHFFPMVPEFSSATEESTEAVDRLQRMAGQVVEKRKKFFSEVIKYITAFIKKIDASILSELADVLEKVALLREKDNFKCLFSAMKLHDGQFAKDIVTIINLYHKHGLLPTDEDREECARKNFYCLTYGLMANNGRHTQAIINSQYSFLERYAENKSSGKIIEPTLDVRQDRDRTRPIIRQRLSFFEQADHDDLNESRAIRATDEHVKREVEATLHHLGVKIIEAQLPEWLKTWKYPLLSNLFSLLRYKDLEDVNYPNSEHVLLSKRNIERFINAICDEDFKFATEMIGKIKDLDPALVREKMKYGEAVNERGFCQEGFDRVVCKNPNSSATKKWHPIQSEPFFSFFTPKTDVVPTTTINPLRQSLFFSRQADLAQTVLSEYPITDSNDCTAFSNGSNIVI